MANTSGEKELKTNWPHVSGLTAGTTKQKGRTIQLIPTEGSNVPRKDKVGMID